MSLIRVILVVFTVFVLNRVRVRYKRNEISFREWIIWTCFWLAAIVATFFPGGLDFLAKQVNLETGRGVDLAVYVSVPILFYLLFRVIAKLDSLQQNQTKIIRHLAISNTKKNQDIKDK